MLGIVAERFPKGGALSLNVTSAVGMMSVGVIGTVFLGRVQDHAVESQLEREQPALHQQVVTEKDSVLGSYRAVNPKQVERLEESERKTIAGLSEKANKNALATVAILPAIMFLGYLGLMLYFRRRGGYKAVQLRTERPASGVPPPEPLAPAKTHREEMARLRD